MNYIVYLAHGDTGYLNECRYSILKYLHAYNLQPPADTTVVIYTDKPAYFEIFIPFFRHFLLETVDAAKINSWISDSGYVHRAKTKMIQEVLSRFGGNIIFFDTDTFITKPIEAYWQDIANGTVYFHTSEGVIDREKNAEFKKWDKFLASAHLTYAGKTFTYNKNFQVWNSGVLGLSSRYLPVIDETIDLIDSIYKQFPKHITEQVASSYCFQLAAPIKAAESNVYHYWNLKEFRTFLHRFFTRYQEESIPNLIKLAHTIDVATIQSDKIRFEHLSLPERLYKKILGKGWHIRNYDKRR